MKPPVNRRSCERDLSYQGLHACLQPPSHTSGNEIISLRKPQRAIIAVGRSILMIVWALLSNEDAHYLDLGPDYYDSRTNPQRRIRHHVHELQALGYTVILNPAA